MIGYIIHDDCINLTIDGAPYSVPKGSPAWNDVIVALRRGTNSAELLELVSIEARVARMTQGAVKIVDGVATLYGETLPDVVSNRLLDLVRNNLPFSYILNFWLRLKANPSRRAVQEFYRFVEHKDLAITTDGFVMGYKAIRNDWTDKHSGKFANTIGAKLEMPRNAACDDADLGCSYGFHVGSLEYVKWFACGYGSEGGDRIVLVKFDPADVVSVPKDCSCQKVRVCKYEVLSEFKGQLPGFVADTSKPYDQAPTAGEDIDPFADRAAADDTQVRIYTQEEVDDMIADAERRARRDGFDEGYDEGREDEANSGL